MANPLAELLSGRVSPARGALGPPILPRNEFSPAPHQVMENRDPYLSENIADLMARAASGISGKPYGEALRDSQSLIGLVPGVNAGADTNQAFGDIAQGNYGSGALNLGGAFLDALPEGGAIKGMLIGASSPLFNRAMARKAEQMHLGGASDLDIWNATRTPLSSGTIIGAEGAVKQEIPDARAKIIQPVSGVNAGPRNMREFIDHPAGYTAYPGQLDQIPVEPLPFDSPSMGDYRYGSTVKPNRVRIRRQSSPENQLSTGLHEGFSHAVGDIESLKSGWAVGGDPNTYKLTPGVGAYRTYENELAALETPMSLEQFNAAKGQSKIPALGFVMPGNAEYDAYLKAHNYHKQVKADEWRRQAERKAREDAYWKNSSEAEARNIQARHKMFLEELRATSWHDTLDVPTADQFVITRDQWNK